MIKTILSLSGGMDSVTLLYQLLHEGRKVKCISFNYGQRHIRELEQAKKVCEKLGIEHKIIDMSFMRDIASNSSLTGTIPTPHGHYESESMKLTVVPNRNMVMASIAIAWAVNLNYNEVALAVHAGDHAIYPDCRLEFILALNQIAQLANFKPIRVYAPFLNLDKGDIALRGKQLLVPYENTHTCYEGTEIPCGKCGACQERAEAFEKAELADPLIK